MVVGAAASALAAGAAAVWRAHRRRAAAQEAREPHEPCSSEEALEAEELLAEQLSRNAQFLGSEAQARVADSFVVVVGVGAVGSHLAALLARTGVRRLRLVDPGTVTEAALRSHAVASRCDLGLGLAEVTRRELLRTVPGTRIEATRRTLTAASAAELLGGAAQAAGSMGTGAAMVVLCVPDVEVAALGVASCEAAGTRCLVVLSAAAREEGSKEVAHQRLSSLHDTCGCWEARRLAARLRPILAAQAAAAGHVAMQQSMAGASTLVVHSGASRAIGAEASAPLPRAALASRGAVLAGLGHAAAAACLCELAGVPLSPSSGAYSRANREDAHRLLLRREREVFGASGAVDVWPEDVEFLATEVWGGRCPFSGACLSGGVQLVLTRWDRTRPAAVDNLVLASKEVADRHDKAEARPLTRSIPLPLGKSSPKSPGRPAQADADATPRPQQAPLAQTDSALVRAIERTLATARAERQAWAAPGGGAEI